MTEPSYYAKLLGESFESLRSASEPGQRSSGGAMIEIVTPNDPVLGTVVPVPEAVRSALVNASVDVVNDPGKDNSEDGQKSNPKDTSLESSSHDPNTMAASMAMGKLSGELNLVVNGVHMADSVNDAAEQHAPVVAIMTPNDVVPPRTQIILLQGEDENDMSKAYLSTEGYKVVTNVEELIAYIKR